MQTPSTSKVKANPPCVEDPLPPVMHLDLNVKSATDNRFPVQIPSTSKAPVHPLGPASGTRPRAVIYIKRGHGGKVGHGGHGRSPAHTPSILSLSDSDGSDSPDGAVSTSSGQTSSGEED
jgi:hypothetical protein